MSTRQTNSTFNSEKILEHLLDFIVKTFVVERETIDIDKSLVQTGVIDSIGLIEITDFIESSYNFKVDDNELNRDNFGSVNRMVHFISNKLGRE